MANRTLAHNTEERGLRALGICAAGMLVRCCGDCQREGTRQREQKQKDLTQQCAEKGGEIRGETEACPLPPGDSQDTAGATKPLRHLLRLSAVGRDAKLRAEHVRLRTALSENERLTLPFSRLIV